MLRARMTMTTGQTFDVPVGESGLDLMDELCSPAPIPFLRFEMDDDVVLLNTRQVVSVEFYDGQ